MPKKLGTIKKSISFGSRGTRYSRCGRPTTELIPKFHSSNGLFILNKVGSPCELFLTKRMPEPAGIRTSLKGAFPAPNFFQPPEWMKTFGALTYPAPGSVIKIETTSCDEGSTVAIPEAPLPPPPTNETKALEV